MLKATAKEKVRVRRFDVRVGGQASFAGRQWPRESRGDKNDEFSLAFLIILAAKQRAQNRDRAEARELGHLSRSGRIQKTGEADGLPVAEFHRAGGAPFRERGDRVRG